MSIKSNLDSNISQIKETKDKSIASKIKKYYNIYSQENRQLGTLTMDKLNILARALLEDYDSLKQIDGINETLELIVKDYNLLKEERPELSSKIDEQIFNIHVNILGNPGTDVKGMDSEYLEKIIKRKVADENGFNRDDIFNILKQHSQNMYLDIESYQELINNTILPIVDQNIEYNLDTLQNPKVLDILSDLAKSYKAQNNLKQSMSIYSKGLALSRFEDTPEYEELKYEYNSLNEYMSTFSTIAYPDSSTLESFLGSLEKIIVPGMEIFTKPDGTGTRVTKPDSDPSEPSYKMPTDKKLTAIYLLMQELKKQDPSINITKLQQGTDSFSSYVIFPIDNTNISILENINSESNDAIYIIKNESIEDAIKLSRGKAKSLDSVETANHVEDFNNYLKNLFRKTFNALKETSPSEKFEEPINFSLPEELPSEEHIRDTIPTEVEETPAENAFSEDLDDLSLEDLKKEDKKVESELSNVQDDIETLKLRIAVAQKRQALEAKRAEEAKLKAELNELLHGKPQLSKDIPFDDN